MWKRQDDPNRSPGNSATAANPYRDESIIAAMAPLPERGIDVRSQVPKTSIAHIGKSVQIKGELTGSEDLFIDGHIEGSIELPEYNLTIGESGQVKANVNAKTVIILGALKGNIRAVDNVTIRKSGSLVGDVIVAGVVIEEGAYFKGSIDIQKSSEASSKPSVPKKTDSPGMSAAPSQFAAVAKSS